MGKVMSMVVRKTQRFNAENRAHRFLEKTKDKAIPAPKYEADAKELNRILQETPNVAKNLMQKNPELDGRLKQVYVTSSDPVPQLLQDESKSLPLDRTTVEDFEYGFKEPNKVSRGRITLRNGIDFINNHHMDQDKWTPIKIAADNRLKLAVVENVLKYFKPFQAYIPDKNAPPRKIEQEEEKPQLVKLSDMKWQRLGDKPTTEK